MKVRQKYICNGDEVIIRYVFNKIGLIKEYIEVGDNTPFEKDEVNLPKIEVTGEMFARIISNPNLQ